jgi:hypothetical protein
VVWKAVNPKSGTLASFEAPYTKLLRGGLVLAHCTCCQCCNADSGRIFSVATVYPTFFEHNLDITANTADLLQGDA